MTNKKTQNILDSLDLYNHKIMNRDLMRIKDLFYLHSDIDMTQEYLSLLVEGSENNINLPGKLAQIDNIYALRITYSQLIDLLAEDKVLKIELSDGHGQY